MLYAVTGIIAGVLAVIATLWYNARRTAVAESTADVEKQARVDAEKRAEALENARLRVEAAARVKDVNEGTQAVGSGHASAVDYFVRSFPQAGSRHP